MILVIAGFAGLVVKRGRNRIGEGQPTCHS